MPKQSFWMFTQSIILLSLAVVSHWVTNLVLYLWKSSLINYCLPFAAFKKLFVGFQKVVRRLPSLPGFSTLVECDTYLPRYYQFMVGKVLRISCPRAYKSSVSECKTWALRFCRGMSVEERQWLLGRSRTRRSNGICDTWGLGIFPAIWTGTGHKCEENHVIVTIYIR